MTRSWLAVIASSLLLTMGGMARAQTVAISGGYDSTSMKGAVRNIGMVAGSYTLQNSVAGTLSGHQMIGVDMTFTPEPGATGALIGGLGMLGFLAWRPHPSWHRSGSNQIPREGCIRPRQGWSTHR